ncbi:2-amino-4-hydroxy-6-hydroxymethyldihydropteridine diphosphokinase [Limosilactobacillus sp.]|uniref:2-amino-4-hydroxy-6- hydroxymethyldihydropteridine diphosphokinase n=1 Tax=Limosilactobacillus sp. TaxID=2773925 RepID=UPI00345E1D5A
MENKMERAYLSIGTNIGDRRHNLQQAVDMLPLLPEITVAAVSPIYVTEPVGGVIQRNFYNIAAALDTRLTPLELLDWLHVIEQSLHRKRIIHWGPRTIDLDLLYYGRQQIDLPTLQVPHPQIPHRRFVLQPMLDVTGDDPRMHRDVQQLIANTDDHHWIKQLGRGLNFDGPEGN